MPKILSASQLRAWDAYTMEHEPIASIDLMERAVRAFADWFTARFDNTQRIGVVCGTGKNGGDGLGIARVLYEWNFPVEVWIVKGTVAESPDFATNLQRLPNGVVQHTIRESVPAAPPACDVLIDAVFGYGLSRPVAGLYADVIRWINRSRACKVAVDIPSGLLADAVSEGEIVKADFTVTFQTPKLSFFLPTSGAYVGEWKVVNIGLSKIFLANASTPFHYLAAKQVRNLLRPREKFSHKGTHGHALLVAGSKGKMGACVLAARAVLRAGVGLLTAHVPGCGYTILQTAVPECMVSVDGDEQHVSTEPTGSFDAIGVGPGIGTAPATGQALASLLKKGSPMVLDADALNLISMQPALRAIIPAGAILTPHPKEFERLAGPTSNDFERLERQQALAAEWQSVVLLKGAHTSVALPDGRILFNTTGNPAMATAGSGDVLTGVLTSLLAQGYPPEEAALLGVYVHGLAGDGVVRERGYPILTASELVDFLVPAFARLAR
jgi:NAD(P)H-hydrate epimerase